MVAVVVPLYVRLLAVMPEVIVTFAGFTTWLAAADVEAADVLVPE